MRKKIATMAAAMAMSVMMAMSSFASNDTGPFIYYDAGQTDAALALLQGTITKIVTMDGEETGTTDIAIYITDVTGSVIGSISSITIAGDTQFTNAGVITFAGVENSMINANGLVQASITLSYSALPIDLGSIYLDVIE